MTIIQPISLLIGSLADKLFGDPISIPHPIVWIGKAIAILEQRLNRGNSRFLKGTISSILIVSSCWFAVWSLLKITDLFIQNQVIATIIKIILTSVVVFYCLAAKTLVSEVRGVFAKSEESLEKGRKALSRIVGRDTSQLTKNQIRTAALETLSENLSDGVIAPLFWFAIGGAPAMLAYKAVNTLDSMIGYKSERYFKYGKFAARLDDLANYIPARISALLIISTSSLSSTSASADSSPSTFIERLKFVLKYGRAHSSPNSGYPESAMAALLNCRFGGPSIYFGQLCEKPYIGTNQRELTLEDCEIGVRANYRAEFVFTIIILSTTYSIWQILFS